MSEVAVHDEAGMQDGMAQGSVTAGMLLRHAREAAGLSLPGLAAALKVPAPKLAALEEDDYASFQDHVFMRALAQSVCRTLRMDSAPVMALLPRTQLKSLADDRGGINATFKERSFKGSGAPLGREQGTRKVAIIVLLLLAAAAAVYFVPMHDNDGSEPAQAGTPDAVALVQPAAVPGAEPVAAQEPAAAERSATNTPAAAAPEAPATAPAAVSPAPAAAAPAAAASAAAATAAAAPIAATPSETVATDPAAGQAPSGLLVMHASAQSWVQVKDANGKLVLQKTLAAGESVGADGALPLSVVIGNAGSTEVRVRGQALEVSKSARDNVARFEVK
ncbi:MAG: helix-turn-helix domain-containing protein [Burkholderiaceae bacterium]|jgi:cytoskeleton protein RodZ|nr:helix-turn-helix domain-containing protein [Burkholderiaceae bacterium]